MSDIESSLPESQPITADAVPPLGMDLEEMLRILDVASELGREQEVVEREFNREQIKQRLRERLMETAQLTGEPLTELQADAAVDWYYDHLHQYQDPRPGFSLWLAHLYIRRHLIFGVLLSAILIGATIWALWLAPFAPFSAKNIRQQNLDAAQQQIDRYVQSIRSITTSPEVLSRVDKLKNESRTHYDNAEPEKLEPLEQQLEQMEQQLKEDFTITVVGGENQKSGFERNYEDEQGKRLSGYYLVVEARQADGTVLPRSIRNAETDTTETVSRWAERVPRAVYERLLADKQGDGVLDETVFAIKRRGETDIQMIMPAPDQMPLTREAQITRW